jgi:phenylpropionate dioxygenase-like ring-hydroxylating dioxygenase large terminal subunit
MLLSAGDRMFARPRWPYDPDMDERALLLSPRDYVDVAAYDREVERVLGTAWLPMCRADQVPAAGDRIAVTLLGRPLVCVRDGSGHLRVLANVCAHRGSTVVPDGAGSSSVLVCPYHRWVYRLDGGLVGAPLAGGADLEGACLPEVRHVVWEGFVLVDLSGRAPGPDLVGLSDVISPWRWSELVTVASRTFESRWNWKVMVENWIECYHHIGTHRETVEPVQPAHTTKVLPGNGEWAAMTVESIEGLEGEPAGWIPGLAPAQARLLSVWSAFPLVLGGSVARYAFWLHVLPATVDRHTVTWHLLAHPERSDLFTPDRVEEVMAMLAAVHEEDMATCANVQVGMSSGLIDHVRLTDLEAPIADLHRWVRARLTTS